MSLFSPFRAVGVISGKYPSCTTILYGEPIIMVPIGHTYILYRGKTITLLRCGPEFEHTICAVAMTGRFRFIAEGTKIHAFSHNKLLWVADHNPIAKIPASLLLAQDDFLFSYGKDKHIVVFHIRTGVARQTILIEENETVTSLVLPSGYTNKIIVGTLEGTIQIFNIVTGKCLWRTMRHLNEAITAICSSEYLDIIAYGTNLGRVVVYNFATDSEIATFYYSSNKSITSISFRMDRDGFLLCGNSQGELVSWNIADRSLDGVFTRTQQVLSSSDDTNNLPHQGVIHSILPIPGEPLVVTIGDDNAILQYRFDTVDGLGLLVRERRGHLGPCTVAQFYDDTLLLTAGVDSQLRVTHLFSDRASWALSHSVSKRSLSSLSAAPPFSPVVALASSSARHNQWSSVVSIHENSDTLYGWRMDTRTLDYNIRVKVNKNSHVARCVALSGCGRMAVIGFSDGQLIRVQLQNQSMTLFRGPNGDTKTMHRGSVKCVGILHGNRTVVSGGSDSYIFLWDLQKAIFQTSIKVPHPIDISCIHSSAALFFVAMGGTIGVYHCDPNTSSEYRNTAVRFLNGHNASITALAIEPYTQRYIISGAMDSTLLIWDLAAAACVGQYRVGSPVASLSFHPDGLFLLTTHVGKQGAFLWTNHLRYGMVTEIVSNPKEFELSALPLLKFPISHVEDDLSDEWDNAHEDQDVENASIQEEQESRINEMNSSIKTNSLTSKTDYALTNSIQLLGDPFMWSTLFLIDQIKMKNQPILPPKKYDVPFFLSSLSTVAPTFIVSPETSHSKIKDKGSNQSTDTVSPLSKEWLRGIEGFNDVLSVLKTMLPQHIDFELRRFLWYSEDASYTDEEIQILRARVIIIFQFITECLKRRVAMNLCQGILANLLRFHSSFFPLLGQDILIPLKRLLHYQIKIQYELAHLVDYPLCLTSVFTGTLF